MNKPEKLPQDAMNSDIAGPKPRHQTTQVMVGLDALLKLVVVKHDVVEARLP